MYKNTYCCVYSTVILVYIKAYKSRVLYIIEPFSICQAKQNALQKWLNLSDFVVIRGTVQKLDYFIQLCFVGFKTTLVNSSV